MTSKEVEIKPQVTPVYSFRPGAKSISLRPGGGKLSSASALETPPTGYSFPLQIPKLDVESSFKSRKRYTIDELLTYRQAWTKLPSELIDSNFEILTTYSSESGRASREPGYSRQPDADERDWRSRTTSDSGAQEASQRFQGSRKPYVSDSAPKNVEVKQTNGNYPASSRETPQIVRSANPWMPRRADVDDKDKVMRTVKGILNKLTPEKFDLLLEQMISAGISTASILQDVIKLVFDKAVLEPTFCSIYAEMCFRLSKALPEFPGQSEEGQPVESVKPITFRRVLLNTCQEEFEGSSNLRAQIRNSNKSDQKEELEKKLKMRTLGNIRLIGELFKQKMVPEKIVHACIQNLLSETKSEFAEDNVEALCYLLTTVGKGMEESARSKEAVQSYMESVRELVTSRHLSSRIRFMCRDLIDLRSNAWVPRREEVKAKKLDQIHAEAEEKLGLRPGSTANMKGLMPSSTSRNALFPPAPNSLLNPSTGTPPMVELDGWETVPVNRRGKKDPSPSLSSSSSSSASLSSTPSSSAPRAQSALIGMRKANIGGSKENQSQTQSQGTGRSRLVGKSSALVSGLTTTAKPVPQQNVIPEVPTPVSGPTIETAVAATKPLEWNDTLKKKSNSLLQEFFSIADLKEALLCVQEMKLSGSASAEFVNLSIMNSFEGKENARSLLAQLLPYLFSNGALTKGDIVQGFVLVGNAFEDITLDYPRSPSDFGSLLASCFGQGCVDTAGVSDILKAIEDYSARNKVILFAASKIKEIGVIESEIRALFENSALIDLLKGEGEESSVLQEIEKSIGLTLAIRN